MSRTPATDWYQDDRQELWDDDADACPTCGGDGVVGWFDHHELHGDDNAEGLEDHLVECPECANRAQSNEPPQEPAAEGDAT
jgi:ribosomal protein S27AE